jgi:uracil-DNA glycosylase family 4
MMPDIDFTALHADMRACRRCLDAGYDIATGAVFSAGPAPQVMLIGQAPGITEAETKRPFNASSGRRLFQWLGEAGFEENDFRARQYMTAVTKCYPGRTGSGKGDRVPSKEEQRLCRPFLEREIRLANPRLMILVGGLAIKLLFPAKLKLAELIGTAVYFEPAALTDPLNFAFEQGEWVRAWEGEVAEDGRYVVPLPHPSGASLWPNKPENKRLIAKSLRLLSDIREGWGL